MRLLTVALALALVAASCSSATPRPSDGQAACTNVGNAYTSGAAVRSMPLPSLASVTVAVRSGTLRVTWSLDGRVPTPPTLTTFAWGLVVFRSAHDALNPRDFVLTANVTDNGPQLRGSLARAGLSEATSGGSKTKWRAVNATPTARGNLVVGSFPASSLHGLRSPFYWRASQTAAVIGTYTGDPAAPIDTSSAGLSSQSCPSSPHNTVRYPTNTAPSPTTLGTQPVPSTTPPTASALGRLVPAGNAIFGENVALLPAGWRHTHLDYGVRTDDVWESPQDPDQRAHVTGLSRGAMIANTTTLATSLDAAVPRGATVLTASATRVTYRTVYSDQPYPTWGAIVLVSSSTDGTPDSAELLELSVPPQYESVAREIIASFHWPTDATNESTSGPRCVTASIDASINRATAAFAFLAQPHVLSDLKCYGDWAAVGWTPRSDPSQGQRILLRTTETSWAIADAGTGLCGSDYGLSLTSSARLDIGEC